MRSVVKLPTSVIGDINPFHSVIYRDAGVLGRGDAFDRERNRKALLDALDRMPVKRRLKCAAFHAPPAGGDVALGKIALAPAVMGSVDGEAEARVTACDGPLHMVIDPRGVTAHVKLIKAQGRGNCRR